MKTKGDDAMNNLSQYDKKISLYDGINVRGKSAEVILTVKSGIATYTAKERGEVLGSFSSNQHSQPSNKAHALAGL